MTAQEAINVAIAELRNLGPLEPVLSVRTPTQQARITRAHEAMLTLQTLRNALEGN